MKYPSVSVVMSVYNGECFLREAVDSVLGQAFEDFEFIIVDDGSTDTSSSTLDAYGKHEARIRLYRQDNRGLIDALNRGCRLARGKYIARMDADDIALPDRLRRQVNFLEQNPQVGVVGTAIEVINEAGQAVAIHRYPMNHQEISEGLRRGENPLVHPSVLIRSEAFCSVGGYRSAMVDAEDYDLWLRIAKRSHLANLDTVLLKYRRHPHQVSIQRSRRQALCHLAAWASAGAANDVDEDASSSVPQITSSMLLEMGVSERMQQVAIARGYLTAIQSMYEAREYSVAGNMVKEMLCSEELGRADIPVIADLRLLEARLHWRQRRWLESILRASQAVLTRPIVLGRPLKPWIERHLGKRRMRQGGIWQGRQ